MSWLITNLIAAFLLPPLNLLIISAIGLLLWYRRPIIARYLLITSFSLLWVATTPFFTEGALHLLETHTTALGEHPQDADAIVILGGGSYVLAPEYAGQDTVSAATLVRLRYGANLQRKTGKPILVTGGTPLGTGISEAEQMRSSLEQDFHAHVRWAEDRSDNTMENARYSFQTLHQSGIRKIYLVTHAWHMPRAAEAFRHAGFEVVEAPTAFVTRHALGILEFLPRAEALLHSKIFTHELIGLLWYRLKSDASDTHKTKDQHESTRKMG